MNYNLFIVIAMVIVFVIVYSKLIIDERKGKNSKEKQQIFDIIEKLVPKGATYTKIYGTWQQQDVSGQRRFSSKVIYKYYGVAFNENNVWLIPITFENGTISHGKIIAYNKENLGAVNSDKSKLWLRFFDKELNYISGIMVAASNTKEDKMHPVNIQQKEEVVKFKEAMAVFEKTVNEYNNVEIADKTGIPVKK